MIGRRVSSVGEIEQPGDYCGPIMWGEDLSCLFRLPREGHVWREV